MISYSVQFKVETLYFLPETSPKKNKEDLSS